MVGLMVLSVLTMGSLHTKPPPYDFLNLYGACLQAPAGTYTYGARAYKTRQSERALKSDDDEFYIFLKNIYAYEAHFCHVCVKFRVSPCTQKPNFDAVDATCFLPHQRHTLPRVPVSPPARPPRGRRLIAP
jgi:hypothetical protein